MMCSRSAPIVERELTLDRASLDRLANATVPEADCDEVALVSVARSQTPRERDFDLTGPANSSSWPPLEAQPAKVRPAWA